MQSKLLPTLGGDFHILLRCKVLSKHPVPVLPPLRSHKSMGIGQCESSVRVTKTHSRVGEWEARKAQCKDRSALAAELCMGAMPARSILWSYVDTEQEDSMRVCFSPSVSTKEQDLQ